MEILTFTAIGIISRLIPHLPNMTPVGATALFSGANFGIKKGMIILLLTMLITDVILGLHPVMWATYGSFMIMILIGKWLQKNCSFRRIIIGIFVSSLIFFIVTNFAVWVIPGSMYPKTFAGLLESYIMALPFFRNSLIGDFSYSALFFGSYALVKRLSHDMMVV